MDLGLNHPQPPEDHQENHLHATIIVEQGGKEEVVACLILGSPENHNVSEHRLDSGDEEIVEDLGNGEGGGKLSQQSWRGQGIGRG